MPEIPLTGLRADLPIGFMAACGCLRICSRTPSLQDARLRWVESGGTYTPILSSSATSNELVQALLADVKNAPERASLKWSEQIKSVKIELSKDDVFQEAISNAIKKLDKESLEWFTAFGTELCVTDKDTLEPTPFDMSVARQRFLADAIKLAKSLSGPEPEMNRYYREALFGPWLYQDDQHSLGWDPSTLKMGAFTYKAPTAMPNTGVRAAVWLAFESLPLFPCFFNGRLRTRAFRTRNRTDWFYWPIWEDFLSLTAIRTLLSWPSLTRDFSEKAEQSQFNEFRARGIIAIYRSAQYKPNKYLKTFRMPEQLLRVVG